MQSFRISGAGSETGWSGPDSSHSISSARSGAAGPLLRHKHKKQRRNKKQKAEQELSASPTGHGDIVDSDLGTPLAVVGQEGLSEDVTSRLSDQGGCPLGRGPRGGSCCYKALGSIAGPWVSELEEAERRSEATGLCPDFPDPRSFDCVPPGNEKPDLQRECSSELR